MKKTVFGMVLVATTVLAVTVSTQTADAAREEKTDVNIGFEKGGDGEGPFSKNLNIAKYPSELDFGRKNKVGESGAATIDLTPAEKEYLAVMDDRDDKLGWSLYAQASDLVDVKEKTKKLTGSIKLTFDELKRYNMEKVGHDYELTDPEKQGTVVALEADQKDKYEWYDTGLAKPVELELGAASSTKVLSAKADTSGAVISDLKAAQIIISKGAEKNQNYNGKVTWTLSTAYGATY